MWTPNVSIYPLGTSKLFVSRVRWRNHDGEEGRRESAVLSEFVAEANRSFKASQSLWTSHTHTHLLSRRFRNYRLRPDHPQEGKQALISALQGPALSPGLSPLHTCYILHVTHRFSNHLTSFSISPEILPQKFADQSCHFHADCIQCLLERNRGFDRDSLSSH